MASAAQPGKKPTLCRYFMNSGSCVYGDDCQFLHQNPMSFQQMTNFTNSFSSGPNQPNGPIPPGQENQGMPEAGSNGDQFFNSTFSDGTVPEFQPFSRQRPPPRNSRPIGSSSNMMQQNSSGAQTNSPGMPSVSSMPFSSMPPKGPPMSHSNSVSQGGHIPTNTLPPGPPPASNHMGSQNPHLSNQGTHMPPPGTNPISQSIGPISQSNQVSQNGPISIGMNGPMPPNMKPGLTTNGMYGDSLTNDFSALNLSIPSSTKGPNPHVNEFVPKLSHSSSSPNFSNFNGVHPPNTTAANNILAGLNLTSSASPSHSPGLSPTNSPLMMRRMGSPVSAMRGSGTNSKPVPGSTIQENVGGTTYFYAAEDFTPQREGVMLPNFSMYQGQPPHIAHMKVKSNMPQFFMADELKMEILNRNALAMAQIDLSQNTDIPEEVDNYHNLFPLEPPPDNPMQKSKTFGYPTTSYKAINTKDGLIYCLRRIHGFRLVNTKCMSLVDMWKKMYHPNIVQLREVFTTKAFGDHSIVFVYDFFPMAETLLARHFSQLSSQLNGFNQNPYGMDSSARPFSAGKAGTSSAPRQHAGLLPESLIWAYVVQLSSALRAIHAAGLSCRTLDPSKIIIYSKSRLRLNCCGIFDVLTYDSNNPLSLTQHYQQEDLVSLGKVVLALACNNVMAIQRENLQSSMELVARNYSADLKNLILYLLGNQSRPRSINDIMPMIGARFYTQLDSAQLRSDMVENELAKEVENGRLFRIISKLGIINDRPEFNLDPHWSETGDRYMLKLFRDYLFHQVDETGAPWVDMSHIVLCLNKLDAGSPEKISLMSRDEQNVLVTSYSELKQCFENAFSEVLNSGHSALT